MSNHDGSGGGLPWWWFLPYLSVLAVFTAIIAVLISVGVEPLVAVGVPVTLSVAAVSALARVAGINPNARTSRIADSVAVEDRPPRRSRDDTDSTAVPAPAVDPVRREL